MTEFDPKKSIIEEISGLVDVRLTLVKRERELDQRYAELEVELNAVRKLRGFADMELDRKRKVLATL